MPKEDKKPKKDKKAKKEKKVKDKPEKTETEEKKEKKEFVFDLSDGVSYHDFIGLFILFFVFIWRVIRLILAPAFWVYGENVRMFRFIRATGKERTMSEDEQLFVESIPMVFTLTGLVGGVLIGIFAAFSFSKNIDEFIKKINLNFLEGFFGLLGSIIGWFWDAIKWIFTKIFDGFGTVFNFFLDLFSSNPFLAFLGLATIGIVVLLFWVALQENDIFGKTFGVLFKVLVWLVGSPERFRFKMDNYYRRFNHALTSKLVGEMALFTRTQNYFKKVGLYTVAASVYSFGAGIYVGTTNASDFEKEWQVILFMSGVLFVAGILSGTLFFALMSRFLDLLNRRKYISPEFKGQDDEIDTKKMKDKINKSKEDRKKAQEVYEKELAKMSEKPWKSKDGDKKSKPKKEKEDKPKEEKSSKSGTVDKPWKKKASKKVAKKAEPDTKIEIEPEVESKTDEKSDTETDE